MEVSDKLLIEACWEVCNKVGGIHTVITSKVKEVQKRFPNYMLVGPFFKDKANSEFTEKLPPKYLLDSFEELKQEGIICHYGTWLTGGEPKVILIDFTGLSSRNNEIKGRLWERFRIDSLNTTYFDFDQPVVWAFAVGKLVEKINLRAGKKIILHAHEWLAGASILYIKMLNLNVATVFTTHATTLGRTLSNSGVNFYNSMNSINPDELACKYHIKAKHQLEKQVALNVDVFTTVSEITAIEAEKFLGRKADVLVPNGLDMEKFPTYDELAIKHKLYKNKLKQFLLYYFFPYYSFDLDETLIYFIFARYEFKAKGIDIFIKALGELNKKLKEENFNRTIVTFFWIPANVKRIRPQLLESKTFYDDLKDALEDILDDVKQKLLYLLISKRKIDEISLFSHNFILNNEKRLLRFSKKGAPPLSTHEIYNEENDSILNSFKEYGLLNKAEDRVKVIYYPIYLTGADGLLDLTYYESIMASHLGVFPSFYEPWGYTPLESAALGIAAVTTDLSGFGRFIVSNAYSNSRTPGVYVLKRFNKKDSEAVDELSNLMYNYAHLDKEDRIKDKIEANKLAFLVDWKDLLKNYEHAYELAVSRKYK